MTTTNPPPISEDRMFTRIARHLAPVAIVTVVLAAAGLAFAQSDDEPSLGPPIDEPAPTFAPDGERPEHPERPGRPGDRPRPMRAAIHGDLLVPGPEEGQFQTVTFDKGELVEVTAGSVTLERPDGEVVTFTVTDDTRMRPDGVRIGEPAMVLSRDGVAEAVVQRRGERPGRSGQRPAGAQGDPANPAF